jgi:hypothetical protein
MIRWLALVVPLVVFVLVGAAALFNPPSSATDFLYRLRTPKHPLLRRLLGARYVRMASLAATNLSVVSAFIYMIDGGAKHGVLMLCVPAAVYLGYYLLRGLIAWANPDGRMLSAQSGGLLASVNERAGGLSKPSVFARVLTGCWVFVYVMFAFFELVMCAKLVAIVFRLSPGTTPEFVVAAAIFGTGMLYSQFGGIRSVMQTDVVQLILGMACVAVLVWWAAFDGELSSNRSIQDLLPQRPLPSLLVVFQGCVFAVATQFYNPYNWHSGSTMVDDQPGEQSVATETDRVLNGGAILTLIVLVALMGAGLLLSGAGLKAPSFALTEKIAASNGEWQAFFLVAGLLSLTISTLDSLMVALASCYYQSFVRTHVVSVALPAVDSSSASEADELELTKVRIVLALLYCCGFFSLMLFYFGVTPQAAFDVMITLASGVSVLSPLLVLAVYLHRIDRLELLTNGVVYRFLGLFILSGSTGVICLLLGPSWLEWIPLLYLSAACVMAVVSAWPAIPKAGSERKKATQQ